MYLKKKLLNKVKIVEARRIPNRRIFVHTLYFINSIMQTMCIFTEKQVYIVTLILLSLCRKSSYDLHKMLLGVDVKN